MVDKASSDLWWKDAVFYCLDVKTWLDADGNGWGDFSGATRRLDYLRSLGVNCVWLMPFYPSPMRDDGYDITDYFDVDPRLGTLGDFVEFVRTADNLGIRVVIDLVLNHTSDQHPWFQAARQDRESPFHDYYVWRDEEPESAPKPVFPGEQETTWTRDETVGRWYFHQYHDFMPDLNIANPAVRDEMNKIMGFWLQLGVAGFRIDSVPFLIENPDPDSDVDPHHYLREIRGFVSRRSGNAILLGEANIALAEQKQYFGEFGTDEMHMLFDFHSMAASWLSMATADVGPLCRYLRQRPQFPPSCQYATFLRSHDELTFESLTAEEREAAFEALDPEGRYRLYDRGLSRRMAPLLDGDERRSRLAFSLMLALPGTPVIFYGEELGMADNPDLPGRLTPRTLMQWTDGDNGGFSQAAADDLVRPALPDGPHGYRTVNVAAQQHDIGSLLSWVRQLVQVRRQCPEVGWGDWEIVSDGEDSVFAMTYSWQGGRVMTAHNLSGEPAKVELPDPPGEATAQVLFAGPEGAADSGAAPETRGAVTLPGYGHVWVRLTENGMETGV